MKTNENHVKHLRKECSLSLRFVLAWKIFVSWYLRWPKGLNKMSTVVTNLQLL